MLFVTVSIWNIQFKESARFLNMHLNILRLYYRELSIKVMVFWGGDTYQLSSKTLVPVNHVISQQTVVLIFTAVWNSGLIEKQVFRFSGTWISSVMKCEFKGWYQITCLKIIWCSLKQAGSSLTSHICQNLHTVGESPVCAHHHQLREVSMDKKVMNLI